MHENIAYNEHDKLWVPANEPRLLNQGFWNKSKQNVGANLSLAMSLCRKLDLAIQAGGNIGIFPNHLIKHFRHVHSFEADPVLFACMEKNKINIRDREFKGKRLKYYNSALGSENDFVEFYRTGKQGTGTLSPNKLIEEYPEIIKVPQITIDSLSLEVCDLIQLDIEGHEQFALEGAKETIKRFSPVIQVETFDRSRAGIHCLLTSYGYKIAGHVSKDTVYKK